MFNAVGENNWKYRTAPVVLTHSYGVTLKVVLTPEELLKIMFCGMRGIHLYKFNNAIVI